MSEAKMPLYTWRGDVPRFAVVGAQPCPHWKQLGFFRPPGDTVTQAVWRPMHTVEYDEAAPNNFAAPESAWSEKL